MLEFLSITQIKANSDKKSEMKKNKSKQTKKSQILSHGIEMMSRPAIRIVIISMIDVFIELNSRKHYDKLFVKLIFR